MPAEKADLSSASAPRGCSSQWTTSFCESSIAGRSFSAESSTHLKFSGQPSGRDACLIPEWRSEWRYRLQLNLSEVCSEALEHKPFAL
jgi:hypothetical protein